MNVAVYGMRGLGDCIFARAFVKTLARDADVFLRTPWRELYVDIPRVSFLYDDTTLRTQRKNVRRQPVGWFANPPRFDRTINVGYGASSLRAGSIVQAIQSCFGVPPSEWDLPVDLPTFVSPDGRPVAVVRPVTERIEWHNSARNPLPQYIAHVAADLMDTHYVVSVADLEEGREWFVGEPPSAHLQLHRGELDVRHLLGMVRSAAVVIGGVGWIVPACVATGSPLFCILGGQGEHNAPSRVTDSRMRLDHVRFATPDRYCLCANMRGTCCRKENTQLAEQWALFRREQGLHGSRAEVADVD